MSILHVYDNWARLVGAVIDRERLQQLAYCDSLSSATSTPSTSAGASISHPSPPSCSPRLMRQSPGMEHLTTHIMLAGAQSRGEPEAVTEVVINSRKPKGWFNIWKRVSSFRYNLTRGGRLFHREVQSIEGSNPSKIDRLRDISSGPTENSTEVPPSPASACCSVREDFWRPTDYSRPASLSGMHCMADCVMPRNFIREINSNIKKLQRNVNQLVGNVPAETIISQQPTEAEDEVQAYIRNFLVASSLYDGLIDDDIVSVASDFECWILSELMDETVKLMIMYVHDPPAVRFSNFYLDVVDSIVAQEKWEDWYELIDDDIVSVASDFECRILGELVDETIKMMVPYVDRPADRL